MKLFTNKQIVILITLRMVYSYREELIITFTSQNSRSKVTKVLTSLSGACHQTIQALQNNFPTLRKKKKKPKVFKFTVSPENVRKATDAGLTIFEYLYRKKQKNNKLTFYFTPPKVEPLEILKLNE